MCGFLFVCLFSCLFFVFVLSAECKFLRCWCGTTSPGTELSVKKWNDCKRESNNTRLTCTTMALASHLLFRKDPRAMRVVLQKHQLSNQAWSKTWQECQRLSGETKQKNSLCLCLNSCCAIFLSTASSPNVSSQKRYGGTGKFRQV